jgi:hypothetical protein
MAALTAPVAGPGPSPAPCRTIELRREAAQTGDYDWVVVAEGEHDLATCEAVRVALAPLFGRVLVDLTACSLVHATVLRVILEKAVRLDQLGYELSVRTSERCAVTRLFDVLAIDERVRVETARVDG